jgi:hypothetical protein
MREGKGKIFDRERAMGCPTKSHDSFEALSRAGINQVLNPTQCLHQIEIDLSTLILSAIY